MRCVEGWVEAGDGRRGGGGGKMYFFCAMYSLRMSLCSVPDMRDQSTPCFSPTARYIAQITGAGELMVIETVTSPRGMPRKRISISSTDEMETPHLPTSPSALP